MIFWRAAPSILAIRLPFSDEPSACCISKPPGLSLSSTFTGASPSLVIVKVRERGLLPSWEVVSRLVGSTVSRPEPSAKSPCTTQFDGTLRLLVCDWYWLAIASNGWLPVRDENIQ